MKLKYTIIFLLIFILLGVSTYTAINGIELGDFKIKPIAESMKLGLDIKGGVYVVLEAQTDLVGNELSRLMSQTQEVIRRRVDAMGLTEPNIVLEGEKRIRIELPGVKNAEEAIEAVGKTAQLKFTTLDGNVVLTGDQVKNAELSFDRDNLPCVALEFNSEGAEIFREVTRELHQKPYPDNILAIVLDEETISAPMVNDEIPNGKAVITGNFTVEEASNLAALIRGGALPVNLVEVQTSTIGPTLGLNSLNTSLRAGIIGLILVLLYMLFFYRLPGLLSDIALIIYILIVLYSLVWLDATLTLPGIAGFILSIGMAVDANVIVFERIKEELREGKTIRASVESGFKKALTTIVDSNVTTFIAALILYYFGLGPIKGFAVTLMIGIIASMFTAVFVTKYLLRFATNVIRIKNTKFFGV